MDKSNALLIYLQIGSVEKASEKIGISPSALRNIINSAYKSDEDRYQLKNLRRFFSIMKRVNKLPCGCWEWTGCVTKGGYPHAHYGDYGDVYVNRFLWELVNPLIMNDYWLVHLCGNKKCLNIKHMRVVSKYEWAKEKKLPETTQ